jgi:hypothetical protein
MLVKRHSMWSRILVLPLLRDEKCLFSHNHAFGFKERIEIIPNYSYASRDPAIDWMFAKLLQERIRTKGTMSQRGETDPRLHRPWTARIHESRQHTC